MGDGCAHEEDVEQRVVPAERQEDEVERVDESPVLPPALGADRGVHHHVPVLAGQNLRGGGNYR